MNQKSYDRIHIYCDRHHLIQPGDKILVGLSGGADSVYLLNFLVKLQEECPIELYAVHVNHGIRGKEASADEAFSRAYASKLHIDFEAVFLNIPELAAERGMSEEEGGRYYRYRSFRRIMQREGCNKIAVAHQRDDQAETLLFQLLRGSGLRGLGGIRPHQDDIIRPLLQTGRQQIEAELRAEGICWCEDSTNQDIAYARNKMRNRVMPYLQKEFQPELAEHLAGTAEQMQEVWDYFYRQVRKKYELLIQKREPDGLSGGSIFFQRDAFLAVDSVLQPYILLEAIAQAAGSRKDIGRVHVQSMMGLAQGETGKRISLPYHLQAGRDYNEIWIARRDNAAQRASEDKTSLEGGERMLPWRTEQHIYPRGELPEGILKNNCTKCFDYAKIENSPVWRHPLPGDILVMDSQGHTKKLSRIMLDAKLPRDRRGELWILAERNHVLWVPELQRSSMEYYVTDETEKVLIVNIRDREQPVSVRERWQTTLKEIIHEMYSEEQITERILELAEQINKDYAGKSIHLICVLKGSVFFCCELAKRLEMPVTFDFIAVSSYGNETSSGKLRITKDLDEEIDDLDCLIVEDIIDSGKTIKMTRNLIAARNPASVRICALLDKPSRREAEVDIDYTGFVIPDQFVVGYGLDYAQKYRNLPYIGYVEFVEE